MRDDTALSATRAPSKAPRLRGSPAGGPTLRGTLFRRLWRRRRRVARFSAGLAGTVLAILLADDLLGRALGAARAQDALPGPVLEEALETWPEDAGAAARRLAARYGAPDEASNDRILWRDRAPWSRIVLVRRGPRSEWPVPHEKVLEQTLEARLPAWAADPLAEFDGALYVESDGDLVVRSDREELNFLAANLAREIASGNIGVGEARTAYRDAARKVAEGGREPRTERLMTPEGRTP